MPAPLLNAEELAVDKVLAVFGRAEARDFADLTVSRAMAWTGSALRSREHFHDQNALDRHPMSRLLTVAKIELRTSVLGGALVGDVQTAPALSWSEHRALVDAQHNTAELAASARGMVRQLESMGLDLQATAASISALELNLGLRLDAQTQLLDRQLTLLGELSEVLRTPAKTRAAERLTDVGELLRRERWKRALSVAEEVTKDDPNNAEGFLACAWANLGLQQFNAACDCYVEAAEATDGLRASELGRQAARVAFAAKDAGAAQAILERFAITEVPRSPSVSWKDADVVRRSIRERTELGAVNYDRAVYAAARGQREIAAEALEDAGELSPEFLAMALNDSILLQDAELVERVSRLLAMARHPLAARDAGGADQGAG